MPKKEISKEKSINRAKTITELVICAVIVGGAVIAGKKWFDNAREIPPTQDEPSQISEIDTSSTNDPNNSEYSSIPILTTSKFTGPLILVNNDHEYYTTDEEDLVGILAMNDETGRTTFGAYDYSASILRDVYEPLARMCDDWYETCYNDSLIVYGAYRTNALQQQLYDEFTAATVDDDEAPIVAPPGFSEHETGYAFDFSETIEYDYQGTGDFKWINDNCYKYGFILRYPADKEAITQYRYEPWHFRYVGFPHAEYMTKNNLCLEEYIDLLRNAYSYDGEHLQMTDESGAEYEIYFAASSDADEYTGVPVPTGYKYDISGNNVDGFIVTVHMSETADMNNDPVPATEAPTTDENTEDTTESFDY